MKRTRLLLATDFDGTIAGIRQDPQAVEIEPAARSFFAWASEREAVEVAFISGRDLEDLRSRTAGVKAWRSGSHGHEIETPEGRIIRSAPVRAVSPPAEWLRQAGEAGLRIEEKKFGIAVHWRGVSGIDEKHTLIREFEEWAHGQDLDTTYGRCVLEAAVAGASKKSVLELLIKETGAQRVVYAGDDVTDLTAIELAAANGKGFFVRSRERQVDLSSSVETVDSMDELLPKMKDEVLRVEG